MSGVEQLIDSRNSKHSEKKKIAIIGGGISGLSSAYFLLAEAERHGLDVDLTLFEAKKELGGVIKTMHQDGVVLDMGPECFVSSKPSVIDLAQELKIGSRILPQAERQTFIASNAKLCAIPPGLLSMNPDIPAFLASDLFSARAKARMAIEPLVQRGQKADDESVSAFLTRRFGEEFLHKLAVPLIGGLYGTDPALLSASATMPLLIGLEADHGSVILGMIKNRLRQFIACDRKSASAKSNAGPMSTFDNGMSVLVEELKSRLLDRVKIEEAEIVSLVSHLNKWQIVASDDIQWQFDAVVLAVPAIAAAKLLASVDRTLSDRLCSIKYSSATVLSLVFDRSAFSDTLTGSGFLVAKEENLTIRACTFSSNKFKRANQRNKIVMRVSCNVRDRSIRDEQIKAAAIADLNRYLNICKSPEMSFVARHQNAIPQFAPGHSQLIAEIEERKSRIPYLALAGNAYAGMGVSDCIMRAENECHRLTELLLAV